MANPDVEGCPRSARPAGVTVSFSLDRREPRGRPWPAWAQIVAVVGCSPQPPLPRGTRTASGRKGGTRVSVVWVLSTEHLLAWQLTGSVGAGSWETPRSSERFLLSPPPFPFFEPFE